MIKLNTGTVDGQQLSLGDHDQLFCLQSTCKPITYAMAVSEHGIDKVHSHVGREPSGRAFNEMALKELSETARPVNGRTAIPHNPMINAGAMMCTSLIRPSLKLDKRIEHYLEVWSRLCARDVSFDPTVMVSERATADRNKALAYMMKTAKAWDNKVNLDETLELYFSTCAVTMTSDMMAVAAATLANGGENPFTSDFIFDPETTTNVLSLMLSCGMYDFSGEWAFSQGLPAKSGVSGTLMIVVPGTMGICIWSPNIDELGNSVRGVAFAEKLVQNFSLHHLDGIHPSNKIDPTRTKMAIQTESVVGLLFAASTGDLLTIIRSIKRGVDPDTHDYDGRTALHLASAECRIDCVE